MQHLLSLPLFSNGGERIEAVKQLLRAVSRGGHIPVAGK